MSGAPAGSMDWPTPIFTTEGSIICVKYVEGRPVLHLFSLPEQKAKRAALVDCVRKLLEENYGKEHVEGLRIMKASGVDPITQILYSCENLFIAIDAQSSSGDLTVCGSPSLATPAKESCIGSSSQSSSTHRDSPPVVPQAQESVINNVSSIKLHNELKELPFQEPAATSLPEMCGSRMNGNCTMPKLKHCEHQPSKSTDCLLQQVQGGQQESHFNTRSKRWSYPYCEGIQSTRVGQSLLNIDAATSSCNVVKEGSSSSEYSHEEKFCPTKEEMADDQGVKLRIHCQETALQEEEGRVDDGKQSLSVSSTKQEGEQNIEKTSDEYHREVTAVQEQDSRHLGIQEQLSNQAVDNDHCEMVQPQPASGNEVTRSQGTPPNACNPMVFEKKKVHHQHSAYDHIVVPKLNVVPKEHRGDLVYIYQNPAPGIKVDDRGDDMSIGEKVIPPDVKDRKDNWFLATEKLNCTDRELMFSSQGFYQATDLSSGANCMTLLPSTRAVYMLDKNKDFPFAASMQPRLQHGTLVNECPPDPWVLPQGSFLGSGGNGITFEHMLRGHKFAVKWMNYQPEAFDPWSRFSHPNIIPLLAVVNALPGCYVVMPRMTGDLGAVMRNVGDLYSLTCSEDEANWQVNIEPNIQHIIVSILSGVAYLHSKGYLHRDLKETNILYLKKCECVDILHCKCPRDDKCDIMLADFDSLEPYLSSCYSHRYPGVIITPAGTRYYRSPETHCGITAPCCDMWSVGVIFTSLCHSSKERKKIREDCRRVIPNPDNLMDKRKIPVIETAYGREMLSSLRKKCIEKPHQLGLLERMAGLCLSLNNEERVSAQKLLDDFFSEINESTAYPLNPQSLHYD